MFNKFLFLDIDGVLNSDDFFSKRLSTDEEVIKKLRMVPYPLSEFDPFAVERVNKILKETDARLVVSSSWRIGREPGELENIFKHVGLPDEFDVTPNLCYSFKKDELLSTCRGNEIKCFLDKHENVKSYVILDDDEDMLPEQMSNFVHCDFMHGLTDDEMNKCIEILKK